MNPIGDEDLKPTHAYDDVAKEEVSETETKSMETNETEIKENNNESNPETESSGNDISQQKSQVPVRKAPPVPPPQKHPSDQQSNHSYEEIAASEVASEVNFLYTR